MKQKAIQAIQTMYDNGDARVKWLPHLIREVASRCQSRYEFQRNYRSAYSAAIRLGILNDVCHHMSPHYHSDWTKDEILKEARKCKTRTEFKKRFGGAVAAAVKFGIYEKACAHMVGIVKWTNQMIQQEALKYNTRTEFKLKNGAAYIAASRRGILDEVCSHMKKVGNRFKRCVYLIKHVNKRYVGITYNIDKRRHRRPEISKIKRLGQFIQLTPYLEVNNACSLETKMIKFYKDNPLYNCLNKSKGGQLGPYDCINT